MPAPPSYIGDDDTLSVGWDGSVGYPDSSIGRGGASVFDRGQTPSAYSTSAYSTCSAANLAPLEVIDTLGELCERFAAKKAPIVIVPKSKLPKGADYASRRLVHDGVLMGTLEYHVSGEVHTCLGKGPGHRHCGLCKLAGSPTTFQCGACVPGTGKCKLEKCTSVHNCTTCAFGNMWIIILVVFVMAEEAGEDGGRPGVEAWGTEHLSADARVWRQALGVIQKYHENLGVGCPGCHGEKAISELWARTGFPKGAFGRMNSGQDDMGRVERFKNLVEQMADANYGGPTGFWGNQYAQELLEDFCASMHGVRAK